MFTFLNWLLARFIEKTSYSGALFKVMARLLPMPTVHVRKVPIQVVIPFNQVGVYIAVKCWEKREPETLDWIDAFEKGCVFFDIGANFGNETLYAALKRDGPRQITCFDPDLHIGFNLAFNLRLNRISNVRNYCLALSDRSGFINVSEYTDYISLPGCPRDEKTEHMTWMMSLDEFIEGTGDSPDYVKIDVDGFEEQVIRGMQKTLRSPRLKSLLIEVNEQTRPSIQAMLEKAGFIERSRAISGADTVNIVFGRAE